MVRMMTRLSWKNNNERFPNGLYEQLCRQEFTDTTLFAEGQSIKVHRVVLVLSSLYFRSMLLNAPHNFCIFLSNISYATLLQLVEFLYRGQLEILHKDVSTFLTAAKSLKIEDIISESQLKMEYSARANETNMMRQIAGTSASCHQSDVELPFNSNFIVKHAGRRYTGDDQTTPKRIKVASDPELRQDVEALNLEIKTMHVKVSPKKKNAGGEARGPIELLSSDDEEQAPTPPRLPTTPNDIRMIKGARKAKIVQNLRGGLTLVYDGHTYCRTGSINKNGQVSWRCSGYGKFSCSSLANTFVVNDVDYVLLKRAHNDRCLRDMKNKSAAAK